MLGVLVINQRVVSSILDMVSMLYVRWAYANNECCKTLLLVE